MNDQLTGPHQAVENVMADGQWRTLHEIATAIGGPRVSEAGVSARIRDLRKPRFGSRIIERRSHPTLGVRVQQYRLDPDERAAPVKPDESLQHAIILQADAATLFDQAVVLACTQCDWTYGLGPRTTVAAANDALARHP